MAGSNGTDGVKPWGWWLLASGWKLTDEDGRTWESVRDAFWHGHLDFPDKELAGEQHELLLRVLTAIDRNWVRIDESRDDLFDGSTAFWRFYMCWLGSVGLVETAGRRSTLQAPLSEEGRAVMQMLQATREPEWANLPIGAVLDDVRGIRSSKADAAREKELERFERESANLPYVFVRERAGHSHLVALRGPGMGARMPVQRVMWSHAFRDMRVRDDFFGWLAERVDRWEDWGALAYNYGAAALTARLLTNVVGAGSRG